MASSIESYWDLLATAYEPARKGASGKVRRAENAGVCRGQTMLNRPIFGVALARAQNYDTGLPQNIFESESGMAQGMPSSPSKSYPVHPRGGRLESWKEIAAYLKRDVRTVQRWEKLEGLPVHRHLHEKLSSVYVYTAELDAWRSNVRSHAESTAPGQNSPKWMWWIGIFGVLVVAVLAVGLRSRNGTAEPVLHARDWVLIAKFQNRTGEALLDGILEAALDRDLASSSFLNIVPPDRLADTLKLMKRPPDTPLDLALGREISLRDGGIRALLTGQIEKSGTSYMLRADLIDAKDGELFARATERAPDQDAVLDAALRLSTDLRRQIREPLPVQAESGQNLERATTQSLRALQFYSQGMTMVNHSSWEAASALLEQAVNADPQFASAHIYLAWCYSNLHRDAEAAPHFRQAFALAGTTTDRERYFILGSYYQGYAKDGDKAIEAYRTLVGLYPDDYWGNSNLVAQLGLGSEEALPYVVRRAQLRPTSIGDNWAAAMAIADSGDDVSEADRYVSRLQGLLSSPEIVSEHPQAAAWTAFYSGRKAWMHDDPSLLSEECDRVRRTMDLQTGPAHEYFLTTLAAAYMALGKFKAAWELENGDEDPAKRYLSLAFISYARDDRPELERQLLNATPFDASVWPDLAIPLLARTGATTEAHRLLSSLESPSNTYISGSQRTAILQSFKGELALAQGQTPNAISLLQDSLSWREGSYTFQWGSEDLSRAWELEGNLSQAIRALESASKERTHFAMAVSGPFIWVHLEGQLARLYRKAGRDEDAERTDAELRRLLRYADADDPLLVSLMQARAVASARPN